MANQWYVVSCKPRKERILYQQLRSRGLDVFYPRLVVSNNHQRRLKIIPYFPGYLFVRMNLDELGVSVIQRMPYVIGLVCFGDKPAYVPDHLLQAIKNRLEKINDSKESHPADGPYLEQNMEFGSLASGQGKIFDDHLPGTERTDELLRMLRGLCLTSD